MSLEIRLSSRIPDFLGNIGTMGSLSRAAVTEDNEVDFTSLKLRKPTRVKVVVVEAVLSGQIFLTFMNPQLSGMDVSMDATEEKVMIGVTLLGGHASHVDILLDGLGLVGSLVLRLSLKAVDHGQKLLKRNAGASANSTGNDSCGGRRLAIAPGENSRIVSNSSTTYRGHRNEQHNAPER